MAIRLIGEPLQIEVELLDGVQLFSREGGGGPSPLGLTTLLPVFGL
ncbi:MAG: hypothetical protein AAF196_04930 [Planctomycetota bacterium]